MKQIRASLRLFSIGPTEPVTDCANNGSFISVQFVCIGCRLHIQVHTYSIHQEAGLKLDVTTWVLRFMQSVYPYIAFTHVQLLEQFFLQGTRFIVSGYYPTL